jgi:hypothetical protein
MEAAKDDAGEDGEDAEFRETILLFEPLSLEPFYGFGETNVGSIENLETEKLKN